MGQMLRSIPFKEENSCFTGKLICAHRTPFGTEFVLPVSVLVYDDLKEGTDCQETASAS